MLSANPEKAVASIFTAEESFSLNINVASSSRRRQTSIRLHGMTSQKTEIFRVNAVQTSNLTFFKFWFVRLLALRPLLAYCASLG
jgi:lipopolysaccharide assembly outer membrane protein LptD (OstA)